MTKIYQPKSFSEQDFRPYDSSSEGISFKAETFTENIVQAAKASEDIFSYQRYQEPHEMPVECFPLVAPLQKLPRCLDMPLRLAGSEDYFLPKEWLSLETAVRQVVNFEHAHNPSWRDYYCYLTVDCGVVQEGEQQRHGGLHVDGFQGARIQPKTLINRSYVATTNGGTRFYKQPFVVVDPDIWNVFQGFDLQAGESFFTAKENTVYLMDAYTVHESGLASRTGSRMFFRLSFDVKEFDRWGNTHNSMLDYDWKMVTRNAHELVETPNLSAINNSPYRSKDNGTI